MSLCHVPGQDTFSACQAGDQDNSVVFFCGWTKVDIVLDASRVNTTILANNAFLAEAALDSGRLWSEENVEFGGVHVLEFSAMDTVRDAEMLVDILLLSEVLVG